jgi:hypothetical protein
VPSRPCSPRSFPSRLSSPPGSRTTLRTRPPPPSDREYTPARSADRHRPEAHCRNPSISGVPGVWWRHPPHRVHYRSGADPEDPHTSRRTARTTARLSRPWPTDRLGRARAGPRRMRRDSDVARRTARHRHRHPQPLTAFHATVRTAREKGGFKAGLRRRDKSGLERG